MRLRRRILTLTGTTIAIAAGAALPAAASASTVYVSNSAPTVTNGKSCAQPGFHSVQAALEFGGSGVKVNICPGTYTEQLEIKKPAKLEAIDGVGTATLALPGDADNSQSTCDTKSGREQIDEISICTSGTVTINKLGVEAIIPLETCQKGLYGIFVGEGKLNATGDAVNGASTSLDAYKGCQHGVAIEVGSASLDESGQAVLKSLTVSGYEKNGPTVAGAGSTMSISASTIKGEGATPWTAQNGIQISFGGIGTVKSTTVVGNECNAASCGATGEQATGVLFYEEAAGSSISGSSIGENDDGIYYASGRATVAASPEVLISKDVLTSNRYEGVELEEGNAALKSDTINGSGRVGIDLFQSEAQQSASESTATGTKVEGQSEAAIKVESDKASGDKPGKFTFSKGTVAGDGTVLINESNDFEVIL